MGIIFDFQLGGWIGLGGGKQGKEGLVKLSRPVYSRKEGRI